MALPPVLRAWRNKKSLTRCRVAASSLPSKTRSAASSTGPPRRLVALLGHRIVPPRIRPEAACELAGGNRGLGRARIPGPEEQLAGEVGGADDIAVPDLKVPEAGTGEIEQGRGRDPARPDDGESGPRQGRLPARGQEGGLAGKARVGFRREGRGGQRGHRAEGGEGGGDRGRGGGKGQGENTRPRLCRAAKGSGAHLGSPAQSCANINRLARPSMREAVALP